LGRDENTAGFDCTAFTSSNRDITQMFEALR